MRQAKISFLLGCYRWSLRLYPAAFRAEFGDEMEAVFASALREAAEEGPGAVAAVFLKETAGFPANLVDAYRQTAIFPGVLVMKREASWYVWPLWVALSLLAIPLAILATMALVLLARPLIQFDGQAPLNSLHAILFGIMIIPVTAVLAPLNSLQTILYGTMLILVTAVLQWLLLRRYLENAAVWIPLTAVGWLTGILLIFLVRPIIEATSIAWLRTFAPPVLGALVGLAQWLYLRRMVDHAGYWVLASTIGYGLLARGALGPFISIPEFIVDFLLARGAYGSFTSILELIPESLFVILDILFTILAPFAITGMALFLLLRQGDIKEHKKQKTENGKRFGFAVLAVLLMIPLFFAGSWVYASGQLTLAKAKGIYATPEEGLTQIIIRDAGEYLVERVEIVNTSVNADDGSQPRVRWVRAWVFADQRPDGRPTEGTAYHSGSYFLRVDDGWVHVSEGTLPDFIGWVMELYGLEGA